MMKHTRHVLGAILIEVTNDAESWVKWTQDKITDLVRICYYFAVMKIRHKCQVNKTMKFNSMNSSIQPGRYYVLSLSSHTTV